jgi:hypothetical protein
VSVFKFCSDPKPTSTVVSVVFVTCKHTLEIVRGAVRFHLLHFKKNLFHMHKNSKDGT